MMYYTLRDISDVSSWGFVADSIDQVCTKIRAGGPIVLSDRDKRALRGGLMLLDDAEKGLLLLLSDEERKKVAGADARLPPYSLEYVSAFQYFTRALTRSLGKGADEIREAHGIKRQIEQLRALVSKAIHCDVQEMPPADREQLNGFFEAFSRVIAEETASRKSQLQQMLLSADWL